MKKTLIYIIVLVVILVGGFYALNSYIYNEKQGDQTPAMSAKDATYVIDGKVVALKNGVSEIELEPGSASKIVTRYFGNEVKLDIDSDGRQDEVFLLTQETGGSGTFYYVVAALNKENGYVGSQGLFLGDRIAPQTTEISRNPTHVNVVVVNYADRKPGDSFADAPSVGKSIWIKLDPDAMQFGEVAQNFEGEADPSRMTLGMKKWTWVSTLYNDERTITPKQKDAFTLTFKIDGTFSASTDCNGVGGSYVTDKEKITFGQMMSTLMFCEGSQEGDFTKMLENSTGYHFTSKGELILDLKFDSGSVTFR